MATQRADITFVTIAAPALEIGSMVGSTSNPGITGQVRRSGGHPDPHVGWIDTIRPVLGIRTLALGTLATLGVGGTECTTVTTYWNEFGSYAARLGASSHTKFVFGKALAVPRSISFGRRADAVLSLDFLGISADGEAHPVEKTAGQSIPATGWDVGEVYTIAKVDIGGTDYDVDDGSLDFGIDARTDGMQSFDVEAWIEEANPVIQLTLPNIDAFDIDGATGAGELWFRKKQESATFYADASAEHVKISWYASQVICGPASGDPRISVPVTIRPLWDENAAHPNLTIASGVAIT